MREVLALPIRYFAITPQSVNYLADFVPTANFARYKKLDIDARIGETVLMDMANQKMQSWMRAFFIIIGVISVVISIIAINRPMLSLEIVLLLIPLVLLINGISWILHGAFGK